MAKSIGVKFTKDGPSIPVELLQALEGGDLVIFCGAGVSRRCGLPDFSGLVDSVSTALARPLLPDEQELFKSNAFDVALGLIENRIGKPSLRRAVREVLEIRPGSDLLTHEALLQLAVSKKGSLRLVTTNFDRAFELSKFSGSRTYSYAPYLPLPGNDWNSVVHLHGGLGNTGDATGEFLVLTSADFGRAYITEGWASRFLTELFRRARAVLFIGYSISDPAVRYIVDAFAADFPHLDGQVAKAFLLSGATSDQAEQHERTWKSRGIEPVIYDTIDNHRLLHETIQNCANRYRSGFFDRNSIIFEYGPQEPLGGLAQEAISQVKWALRDNSGNAARRFSELTPPPPVGWLEFLEEDGLFKIGLEGQRAFRAIESVAPSHLIPPLHPVTLALCKWLCAHLGTTQVVQWTIKNGSHLHPLFASLIRERLAANTTPQLPKGAALFWTFLSIETAPVYSPAVGRDVLDYLDTVKDQSWTPFLHSAVLQWLAPSIHFTEPYRLGTTRAVDLESVKAYAHIELIPAAGNHSRLPLEQLFNRPDATAVARELLGAFTDLLSRCLTYLRFFERANSDYDGTHIDRPSIDEHPQNNKLRTWTIYIDLLRKSWECVAAVDGARAREEVTRWMRIEFPLFRRFVLWSAGKPGGLSPSESVEFLMMQPPSVLWGPDARRELLQYFNRIARDISGEDANKLAELILKGPPRSQYRAEITIKEFIEIKDRTIYIRLAKLRDGGLSLPNGAQQAMDQILKEHPGWDHAITEREEFPAWIESTGGKWPDDFEARLSDYQNWPDGQVISDIREKPTDPQVEARWRGLLYTEPRRAVRILDALGAECFFDNGIWGLALEPLSNKENSPDCVRLFATFGAQLGAGFISDHLQYLTVTVDLYCQEKSKEQDALLWRLWDLLLEPATEATPGEVDDSVFVALNSPIGNLTEALLNKLGELHPGTYEEIPEPIRDRLEMLLAGARPAHRLSRILLARALAWLYRLNSVLVVPTFLTRFDWDVSGDARDVWSGYLTSPQMTPELWPLLRPLLLKVLDHASDLGELESQLYSFFAFLLLREEYPFEAVLARHALTVGSATGRAQVAWYWWRQADSATDYGATLFRGRLKYLLTAVWPLELELRDEKASECLAFLALCCGTEFEDAVATITPLLSKITDPQRIIWSMCQKGHAQNYPNATLTLIDSFVDDGMKPWASRDLRTLLTRISSAEPGLIRTPQFMRLDALVRQFE